MSCISLSIGKRPRPNVATDLLDGGPGGPIVPANAPMDAPTLATVQ
jgi:hypothetical protein